jgi:hypothetical protein
MNGFMEGKEKLSDDDPLARFRVKPGETLNEEDSQELLQIMEEEPQTRSGFWSGTRPAAQRTTNWPQVRSAQLHDAARLAEASARLVNGYAKFRSHVDQQFSLRHTASHNKRGKKLRVSTITHRFSAPRDEAIPDARHLNAEINNDLRPENNA